MGETLTANTTGIADSDGLTRATFAYQWLADDADITDATGSTYTPAAIDAGKAVKVRVTFTDDAGNEESLTSAATSAVEAAAQATQLTASAHGVPVSHDGSAAFTFRLHFSETPADGFSYRTLRDHAFTVMGGEVVKARRLEQARTSGGRSPSGRMAMGRSPSCCPSLPTAPMMGPSAPRTAGSFPAGWS